MRDDVASQVIAKYALTPAAELERTLPLAPDEELVIGVPGTTHYSAARFATRRSFVRVSSKRLCIVRRHGFIRDRIIVIPPGAITKVHDRGPTEPIHIAFRAEGGDRAITVVSWLSPNGPTTVTARDSSDLARPLKQVASALHPGAD